MDESSFKILKRVMKSLVNPLNVEGLEIYMTNHTKKIVIDDNYYDVPLLRISNPKNIPFSYNALIELVINEFKYISKLSGLDLTMYELSKLIIFDDFTTGGNNTHRIIKDRDEMIELVYTVSSDDSYLFEAPIYDCFSDITEYVTFLDSEWQYCDIHIIAI